jgi:hypothetical protein
MNESSHQFLKDIDRWERRYPQSAIRGIDSTALRASVPVRCVVILESVREAKEHFGKEPANSFTDDLHPDVRTHSQFAQ